MKPETLVELGKGGALLIMAALFYYYIEKQEELASSRMQETVQIVTRVLDVCLDHNRVSPTPTQPQFP